MSAIREVLEVVEPQRVLEGAGVRLRRSIATRTLDHIDPFLLFDHFGSSDPADYEKGFPLHPHRGIETVTYVLAGRVAHKDTMGNQGVIGPGAVQWMTAGGGLMHEEMPDAEAVPLDGFQLWVNLPASHKRMPPRYRGIEPEQIPLVSLGGGAQARVIAGDLAGVRGPVQDLVVDVQYLDIELRAGGRVELPVPSEHQAFAYLFQGRARLGDDEGRVIPSTRLVTLGPGDAVVVEGVEGGTRLLLISGTPLHEPIARHGPFVMNTREEIEEALRDLRAGTFVWQG